VYSVLYVLICWNSCIVRVARRCRGREERHELVAGGRGRRREQAGRGRRLPRVGAGRIRLRPRVMGAGRDDAVDRHS